MKIEPDKEFLTDLIVCYNEKYFTHSLENITELTHSS